MIDYSDRISELVAAASQTKANRSFEQTKLSECEIRLNASDQAHQVITEAALAIQNQLHQKLTVLVNRCLVFVFGEGAYRFEIKFTSKRSSTEAHIVLIRDEVEVDPMSAAGGGVVDVVAFALRLASLLIKSSKPRKLMILDEPFRFVSVQYRERVGELIKALAEEHGVQFIMVTHMDELRLGSVVDLGAL